jgi:hypothetical protein
VQPKTTFYALKEGTVPLTLTNSHIDECSLQLHSELLLRAATGATARARFTQDYRQGHPRAAADHSADGMAKSVPMSVFRDAAKNCQLSSC